MKKGGASYPKKGAPSRYWSSKKGKKKESPVCFPVGKEKGEKEGEGMGDLLEGHG